MFQEDFEVIEKKIVDTEKNSKSIKDELEHVIDNRRGALRGSPKTMEKKKNRSEVGKGS
jgi:hypothetical protein